MQKLQAQNLDLISITSLDDLIAAYEKTVKSINTRLSAFEHSFGQAGNLFPRELIASGLLAGIQAEQVRAGLYVVKPELVNGFAEITAKLKRLPEESAKIVFGDLLEEYEKFFTDDLCDKIITQKQDIDTRPGQNRGEKIEKFCAKIIEAKKVPSSNDLVKDRKKIFLNAFVAGEYLESLRMSGNLEASDLSARLQAVYQAICPQPLDDLVRLVAGK